MGPVNAAASGVLPSGYPAYPLPAPEAVFSASAVRPRFPMMMALVVVAVTVVVGLMFTNTENEAARAIQRIVSLIVPLGVLAFSIFWSAQQAAELRDEERRVSAMEDASEAKRFDWLAHALTDILSRPMLSPLHRARALNVYVLALLHVRRFEDAERAAGGMLGEGVPLTMVTSLRARRVYAMLREDRLVDADRALGELRRQDREVDVAGNAGAMVALLGIYRDAVTGHGDDALQSLNKHRATIAKHLGVRVGDADALAAHAAFGMGQADLAATLWHRATLLVSPASLVESYPPLGKTAAGLTAATIPGELLAAGGR